MGIPSLGILELALVATVALGFLVFFLLFSLPLLLEWPTLGCPLLLKAEAFHP
jgi:hypothetical protein